MGDGLDDIRATIRRRAAELGLKPATVSRMATGKPDIFRKFVDEGTSPRADRLRLLCRALGLDFYVGEAAPAATAAREEPLQTESIEVSADASPWDDATEEMRQQATKRLSAVERSTALINEGRRRAEADAIAARDSAMSASVVGAWRRRVQGLEQSARRTALLDAPRTGRPSMIDAESRRVLADLVYRRGPHLTAEHAREALTAELGSAPSLSTIRRELTRLQREWVESHQAPANERAVGIGAEHGNKDVAIPLPA